MELAAEAIVAGDDDLAFVYLGEAEASDRESDPDPDPEPQPA